MDRCGVPILAIAAMLAAGGCKKSPSGAATADAPPSGASEAAAGGPPAPADSGTTGSAVDDTTAPATGMTLTSPAFAEGEPIPRVHAYRPEGENQPPELAWSNLPDGTCELALIVDDPDAPRPEPWVHDVLYKIPVDATPPTMVLRGATVDSVARFFEGTNSWNESGWGGPLPPPGAPHRYFFRLYALDTELDVLPGLTKDELLAAMEGHVLATATLMGTYQRSE